MSLFVDSRRGDIFVTNRNKSSFDQSRPVVLMSRSIFDRSSDTQMSR